MYTLNLFNNPESMVLQFSEQHKSRAGALASVENWQHGYPLLATVVVLVGQSGKTLLAWQLDNGQAQPMPVWVKLLNMTPRQATLMRVMRVWQALRPETHHLYGSDGYTLQALALYRLANLSLKAEHLNFTYTCGRREYVRKGNQLIWSGQWTMDGVDVDAIAAQRRIVADEAKVVAASVGWTAIANGDPRGQGVKVMFLPNFDTSQIHYGDIQFPQHAKF